MSEADDEGGWKFDVEDLSEENGDEAAGTDEDGMETVDGDGDEDGDEAGNVAGSVVLEQPLEPGSPSMENTAFVLLGALSTVLLVLVVLGVI
ncbi:DUF7312 domain-containing protein [Halorientalis sp.]|uniref:DUF7312 domain-containing protein n=1 Tax=Halorientalis sp. TaxID=1931229 RepID=UPI00262D9140|nr:hypothetical protein [Halorientalis sp.]